MCLFDWTLIGFYLVIKRKVTSDVHLKKQRQKM